MAKNFRDMIGALLSAHLAVDRERYAMCWVDSGTCPEDYPHDLFEKHRELQSNHAAVEQYVRDLKTRLKAAEEANATLCERLGALTAGESRISRKDRVLTLSMRVDEIALRTAGLDLLNTSFLKMRQEYEHAVAAPAPQPEKP